MRKITEQSILKNIFQILNLMDTRESSEIVALLQHTSTNSSIKVTQDKSNSVDFQDKNKIIHDH